MKLLKRYANRRLYDAETSRTITLEDVAELIRQGHEIQVLDNTSGQDITSRVLGQTLLKITSDYYNPDFSNYLLSALIREISGNVSGLFNKLVESGIGLKTLTRERLEGIVQSMVEHGDLQISAKSDYLDSIVEQIQISGQKIHKQAAEGLKLLKGNLASERDKKVEELSGKLDEMARLLSEIQKT